MALLEEPIKEIVTLKIFIDGEWVESKGEIKDVVNPVTGKTIAKVIKEETRDAKENRARFSRNEEERRENHLSYRL